MFKKKKTKSKVFIPSKMLLGENASFSMQESFKTLRTNVSFSLPGKKNRCIGIVSANRGESSAPTAVKARARFRSTLPSRWRRSTKRWSSWTATCVSRRLPPSSAWRTIPV